VKKIQFLLIATAIVLLVSCGCIFKPKTVEPVKKENTTTVKNTPATGCERPYAKIGDECCKDGNDNGICDLDESGDALETLPEEKRTTTTKQVSSTLKISSTTNPTSSAPSTTVAEAITTSTTTSETVEKTSTTQAQTNASNQCALNADCGAAYYGSCICSNNNVVQTKYIPMCLNGTCKWRSKSETITCKRVAESSDEAKNNASERCVMGYGRCITNVEYEAFLTANTDTTIIDKVNMESFSKTYKGYTFRNKKAAYYAGESKCYDNIYFLIEAKNSAGEITEAEITWNRYTTVGAIKVKVGGVVKDDNGKDNPIMWVKEA
jgi:hypothetical protein